MRDSRLSHEVAMKEAVIGFIIALLVSAYLAGSETPISPSGWTFANSVSPDIIADVNAGTFQGEVLDSQLPVLAEFYTQDCPHCDNMKPLMNKLASDSQGYLRVVKVDSSANPVLAERYQVSGVPAFVLFKEGKAINGTTGEMSREELETWVKRELDMPVK